MIEGEYDMQETAPAKPEPKKSTAFNRETVLDVHHWTDKLFSFRLTRDPSFRFDSGQFAMIGLEVDGRPLLRAYSMTSSPYDDVIEFYSIKVPDGPLTSRLQHIKVGDTVLVSRKPTGTLICGNLLPGKRLYMLSTGTGIAPFASLIKDPEVYDRFENVVLMHGCRQVAELEFGTNLVLDVRENEHLGEFAQQQLVYYTAVTREPHCHQGRVTDLVTDGTVARDLGLPMLNAAEDRVMLCGNPQMLVDARRLLEERGFIEGSASEPGHYVIEKAFVEK